jgi:hypothetical protein
MKALALVTFALLVTPSFASPVMPRISVAPNDVSMVQTVDERKDDNGFFSWDEDEDELRLRLGFGQILLGHGSRYYEGYDFDLLECNGHWHRHRWHGRWHCHIRLIY